VVYAGEQHNNDHMHEFQLRVVRAMYAQDPRLLIGMEMFQRPYQEWLDRFVSGEIDEAEMLRQTGYFRRWGWDYMYYRPILQFAREHRIPVVALNVPTEVTRKISREGLDSLTPDERKWVAADVDLGIAAHRKYLESVFSGHPLPPGMNFEHFYASQCAWEDTMAESVANGLAAHPGARMAVIVGEGHVQHGYGIPIRAAKRGAEPYTILYGFTTEDGFDADDLAESRDDHLADYLYFTKPAPASPPTPRLGVMLGRPDGQAGLPVTHVLGGGIASLAGMKAGDRLMGINGNDLSDVVELKLALTFMDGRMGTLLVLRDGKTRKLNFDRAWAGQ
jgi:uncharacterized iron-regulated protein